jgi:ribulose 1,5-bisphosphate synthetase/thiazole synthase
MEVTNDNGCSWIKDLIPRTNIKTLKSNDDCEWLIIGAGYTGLSAARKLGSIISKSKNHISRFTISG